MMIRSDDRNLERFLLDELHPSEREEIEQRIFVDDDLFSRVEELEADLVDAFVRNELDADQRERFERALELNPARQEKVILAKLLVQNLDRSKGLDANVVPFTRRYSSVLTAALAAALLVIVIGVPALMRMASSTDATSQPPSTAVDRGEVVAPVVQPTPPLGTATDSAETIEAPSIAIKRPPVPSVSVDPSPSAALQSVSFVLSTVNLRSGTGLSTLEIQGAVDQVVIQLGIESDEFPSYNVDIRNSSGSSVWSAKRLSLRTIEGAPAVSFEVPTSVLGNGRHELVLAGVSVTGTEEIAYVDFAVKRLP